MLKRSIAFILFTLITISGALAQNAPPKPKSPPEPYRALLSTVPFGGSYLGVHIREITKENMGQYGLREVQGVAIEKVSENSPASVAGLMSNDVISRFNGEEVSSVRKLNRLISEVAPDHSAKIVILRNGSEQSFDVIMGKREISQFYDGNFKFEKFPPLTTIPEFKEFPKGDFPGLKVMPPMKDGEPRTFIWTVDSNRRIGIGVTDMTKQLGDYFGVSDGKGLLINSVRENSPASKAGLLAGDIIVAIDGKEVNQNFDLIRAINEKKEGDVSLTIVRNKTRQTVSVTPEVVNDAGFKLRGDLEKLFDETPEMKLRMTEPRK